MALDHKPYNQSDCIHNFSITLCDISFSVRSDSRKFLDSIRRLFSSSAFSYIKGEVSPLSCYCTTNCQAPWVFAIETPDGLHLARTQTDGQFEFDEWSANGVRTRGASWITLSGDVSPNDTTEIILTGYVLRRLFKTLVNHKSSSNIRILHAATLTHNSKCVLILGDSRSGKSTLALAGFLSGMGYLAEDNTIADLGLRTVFPVPMSIRLRPGSLSLSQSFQNLPNDRIRDATGGFRWLIDPCALDRHQVKVPVRLTHILQLKGVERTPKIEPANGVDLAMACIEADMFSGMSDSLETLWDWAACIEEMQTGYLFPGPIDDTVATLKAWLDK